MLDGIIRDKILTAIENGEYPAGHKIAGARELAQRYGVSFLMAQRSISLLEQDGILTCLPRRGTFVREDWQNRLLRNHLVFFGPKLHWISGFQEILKEELPELRFCTGFERGMFELRTTFYLQRDREQYLDLAPYLPEHIGNKDNCFQNPFRGFREPDGRLFGIPFIFSPRVMFYNKNLLREYGLQEPRSDWTWDSFIQQLEFLRGKIPSENMVNYSDAPFFWMNFIFRAGGKLIDRAEDKSLRISLDSPGVVRGMRCLRQLRDLLGISGLESERVNFITGKVVFAVGDRELYSKVRASGFQDFGVVPLPQIPGGVPLTAQATDLICIRKECADETLIRKYVRFMLSERVQNYIGQVCYGIPVLKKAASASFQLEDPRDSVIFREMEHISAEYNIDSSEMTVLIYYGIIRILSSGRPLEPALKEFADALRILNATKIDMMKSGIPR